MHYSDKQQWLQANIGSNDPAVGKIVVKVSRPTGEESWVISYLLNKSADGKDWRALEDPEAVSVTMFRRLNHREPLISARL